MNRATKIITVVLLTFFLGTMFFSLFNMSMGMDMSGGMVNCPFMSHEGVICPMNMSEHMGAWKLTFLSTSSSLVLLMFASTVVLIAAIAPNLLEKIQYRILRIPICVQEQIYTFSYRPLQELFSQGILHPKLF